MKDFCTYCGTELNNDNSISTVNICMDCQNTIYETLTEANSAHMAVFLMCAIANIPCFPELCPEEEAEGESLWIAYLSNLADSGKLDSGEKIKGFADGICEIRKIFGRNVTEDSFAKYLDVKARKEAVEGTAEQIAKWGSRPIWRGMTMNREVYDELDAQYESKVNDFKGQTITPEMENTLVDVSKMRVAASYLMSQGNETYAKLLKSADDRLSSEQMRKKDEKPMENFRVDSQIMALQQAGFVENGKFLNFDKTRDAIAKMITMPHKYDQPLDVCDQMIFDYQNNMRANTDLPFLTELPEDSIVEDVHGEFADEPDEQYLERKKFAGLTDLRKKEN